MTTDPRRDPRHSLYDPYVGLVSIETEIEATHNGTAWRHYWVYDDGTRRQGGLNWSRSAATRWRNKALRILAERADA